MADSRPWHKLTALRRWRLFDRVGTLDSPSASCEYWERVLQDPHFTSHDRLLFVDHAWECGYCRKQIVDGKFPSSQDGRA